MLSFRPQTLNRSRDLQGDLEPRVLCVNAGPETLRNTVNLQSQTISILIISPMKT